MAAFIVCALTGALQIALLSITLKGALNGKMKAALISVLLKTAVYAVGFSVLYFFFMDSILYGAVGFIVGVLLSFVCILIKTRTKPDINATKGVDDNEHGGTD